MATNSIPDLTIKGRLIFRPDVGDTDHDLGEVEFALAVKPKFATGGVIPMPNGQVMRTPIRTAETVMNGGDLRRADPTVAQYNREA